MKKFNIILALAMAVLMVAGLAACGPADGGASAGTPPAVSVAPAASTPEGDPAGSEAPAAASFEGVSLRMNLGTFINEADDQAFFSRVLAGFEEATGATVEATTYAYSDLVTAQMANLIAGDAADVLFFGGGSEYDFYNGGYLEDLDSYFTDEEKADWIFYEDKAIQGGHYLVPYIGGIGYRGIFINSDICTELGLEVPAYDALTWDVLVKYAQAAVAAGYKGYEAPFSGNENAIICNYYGYVNQSGGSLTNDAGQWDFTTDAAMEAMTFIYDMFNTTKIIDSVSYDAATTVSDWVDGNVLFANAAIGTMSGYLADLGFDWQVYNLQNKTYGAFNTTDSFAINAQSENKEAAAALIKYLMSPEVYVDLRESLTPMAACTAFSGPAEALLPEYKTLAETEKTFFPPTTPNAAEIKEALQTHQQLCAMGTESPEEALAAIQSVVDSLAG